MESYFTTQFVLTVFIGLFSMVTLFYTVRIMVFNPLNLLQSTVVIIFVCFIVSVPWEWYR